MEEERPMKTLIIRALAIALPLLVTSTAVLAEAGTRAGSAARAKAPALDAPAPQLEATPTTQVHPVHFDFNKTRFHPDEAGVLKTAAAWLKVHTEDRAVIAGYADARGTKPYNLALAQQRAKSVRDYLVKQGVRPDRIEIVSYGVQFPRCTERAELCWAKNRRVELLIKPALRETS
jgi:peptidoglycan-associated lipoprotein